MRIDIITIFPKMFEPVLNESIIKRAQGQNRVKIFIHDLRNYSKDKHRKVDDRPFGGGSGMVMRPEPIFRTVEGIIQDSFASCYRGIPQIAGKARSYKLRGRFSRQSGIPQIAGKINKSKTKIILLTPQGKTLNQRLAKKLARYKHLILICGHYEGVDERVRLNLVDEEVSIGDYILTGGELPAMVLVDCLVRLLPGVLGDKNSLNFETFEDNLLEYPQYTRPANYCRMRVPSILLSGDHKKITEWRKKQSLKRTKEKRPDLLEKLEIK